MKNDGIKKIHMKPYDTLLEQGDLQLAMLYIDTVLHNILHLGKISNLPVEGAHLVVVLLVPVPVPVLVALGVPIAGDGMADIPIVNN